MELSNDQWKHIEVRQISIGLRAAINEALTLIKGAQVQPTALTVTAKEAREIWNRILCRNSVEFFKDAINAVLSRRTAQPATDSHIPSALERKAAWNRITWPCSRQDFLAWRPREDGKGIEVLTYNYALCDPFYVTYASSVGAIEYKAAPASSGDVIEHNLIQNPSTLADRVYNNLTRQGWDLGEEEITKLIEAVVTAGMVTLDAAKQAAKDAYEDCGISDRPRQSQRFVDVFEHRLTAPSKTPETGWGTYMRTEGHKFYPDSPENPLAAQSADNYPAAQQTHQAALTDEEVRVIRRHIGTATGMWVPEMNVRDCITYVLSRRTAQPAESVDKQFADKQFADIKEFYAQPESANTLQDEGCYPLPIRKQYTESVQAAPAVEEERMELTELQYQEAIKWIVYAQRLRFPITRNHIDALAAMLAQPQPTAGMVTLDAAFAPMEKNEADAVLGWRDMTLCERFTSLLANRRARLTAPSKTPDEGRK